MKVITWSTIRLLSQCGNNETSTDVTKSFENTENTNGNENNGFEMRASQPTFTNIQGNKIPLAHYNAINED